MGAKIGGFKNGNENSFKAREAHGDNPGKGKKKASESQGFGGIVRKNSKRG
ncbi:MAG: hypothetical protein WC254_03325 [Candidatus Woesearchaeota archaeon]|jgi:hypothetical protein